MEIDLTKLESRDSHDILTSSIIPRPIAWVSTINEKEQSNIAPLPFSGKLYCAIESVIESEKN